MNWIELHTDTRYSETLSFQSIERMIATCAANGCAAVAITDRNTVQGYLIAEKETQKHGIGLIYGLTLDCVDREDRYEVTLLAKNLEGRKNIFTLLGLLGNQDNPMGRYVTREQIETHREGLLSGASAHNGQLVRAIKLRRNDSYLKKIAQFYDYIELPVEPYDVTSQLCRISCFGGIPACAVQNATVDDKCEYEDHHAYCAITQYWGKAESATPYQTPSELIENFRELYILPEEREIIEKAIGCNQQWIYDQIEPIAPLGELLDRGQEQLHKTAMAALRLDVENALLQQYGHNVPRSIQERLDQELDDIHYARAAGLIQLMQEIRAVLPIKQYPMFLAGTWNSYFILYLLGITSINPLPCTISTCGQDLLYLPAEISGKSSLLSVEIRLPQSGFQIAIDHLTQCWGNNLTRLHYKNRSIEDVQLADSIANQYLEECNDDDSARLKTNGLFYSRILSNGETAPKNSSLYRLFLLPETDGLPIIHTHDFSELDLDYHISDTPNLMLLTSNLLDVLEECAQSTGISADTFSLDDPAVFNEIRSCRPGDAVSAVEGACRLAGIGGAKSFSEPLELLDVHDLRGLSRYHSMSHSTDLWDSNQKPLLGHGTIASEQLIMCREDVYRYLADRGIPQKEAADFARYVRNGLGARRGFTDEQQKLLKKCRAEDWFVAVCQKVMYLFPEAHTLPYAIGCIQLISYLLHDPEKTEPIIMSAVQESIQQAAALESLYVRR